MRAPLFVIGFSMTFSLMVISMTSDIAAVCGCTAGILELMISLAIPRFREYGTIAASAAAVTVACLLFLIKSEFCYYPAIDLVGQNYKLQGIVTDTSYDEEYEVNRFVVKVSSLESVSGESVKIPYNFKVRVSSKNYSGNIDDKVMLSGKLYKIKYNYYRSKGCYVGVTAYGEVSSLKSDKQSILSRADAVRCFMENTLKKYLPYSVAMTLLGMTDGDKDNIPKEIYDNFKAAGVAHLFSVSGFHTSLWSMLLYRQFLKLGIGKRQSAALSIAFLFAFIAVTGFSRSTVRASLMLGLFFLARILKQSADSLNSLGFAALVICVFDPFACADVGFLMSFFSTLGIFVFYPPMKREVRPRIKRVVHDFHTRQRVNELSDIVLISISTLILGFPLFMLFFNNLSLISPLSNLFISPLASAAIFLGGIGVAVSAIPLSEILARPLFLAAGVLTKLLLSLSSIFAGTPISVMDLSEDYIRLTVAALLIIYGFAIVLKIDNRKLVSGLTALMVFVPAAVHCLLRYLCNG